MTHLPALQFQEAWITSNNTTQFSSVIQSGMDRPRVSSALFWKAMISPAKQLSRSVLPGAAGLVPVRTICTVFVQIRLSGKMGDVLAAERQKTRLRAGFRSLV